MSGGARKRAPPGPRGTCRAAPSDGAPGRPKKRGPARCHRLLASPEEAARALPARRRHTMRGSAPQPPRRWRPNTTAGQLLLWGVQQCKFHARSTVRARAPPRAAAARLQTLESVNRGRAQWAPRAPHRASCGAEIPPWDGSGAAMPAGARERARWAFPPREKCEAGKQGPNLGEPRSERGPWSAGVRPQARRCREVGCWTSRGPVPPGPPPRLRASRVVAASLARRPVRTKTLPRKPKRPTHGAGRD